MKATNHSALSEEALLYLKHFLKEYEMEVECISGATDNVGDELIQWMDYAA